MSHTGALLAASDSTVDALFRQSGVVRTDTLEQLFDVATLLANQPVPAGNRVAILTNAGGLGILCADTCEANGLDVMELGAETVTELRSFLPVASSVSNPVDMIASASAGDYGRAVRVVIARAASLIRVYPAHRGRTAVGPAGRRRHSCHEPTSPARRRTVSSPAAYHRVGSARSLSRVRARRSDPCHRAP